MTGPLYEGLAAELREKVISGALLPGQRLPSEAELGAQHEVSRNTVRQALTLLEREGLILSSQGRGWWVRERNPIRWHISRQERVDTVDDATPNDAWSRDVREQGRTPHERLEATIMEPEPRIARWLQLTGSDELVWVRKRMRFVDGELYCTADTYFPESIVAGTPIARPADVLPGTLAILEQLGYVVARRTNEIVSRNATAVEADRFGLMTGDSVAEVIRTRYAQDGRPIACTVTVAPGDRVVIIIEEETHGNRNHDQGV